MPPLSTPAHKATEHPASQVQAPDRFLHPIIGPLVAREVVLDCCIDGLTRDECAAFDMRGACVCPHHYGGPSCRPAARHDGKPIIWIRDPAYVRA